VKKREKKQAEIITQKKHEKEKRDRQINLLLAKGKAAISTQKLSKPVGNNALEYFQSVLQIDSNNLDAQQGVKDVIKGYISLAEKALKRNDFDKAAAYLQTAETIDPDSKAIDVAKQSVEDQRLDYAQEERERRERLQKEKVAPVKVSKTDKRKQSIVIVGYGDPIHYAGHGGGYNSGDVIASLKKVITKITKVDPQADIHTVDGVYELYLDEERNNNNNKLCDRFGANIIFTGLISRMPMPIRDNMNMYLYDCVSQDETKEVYMGNFKAIKNNPIGYFSVKPIFQRLNKYAVTKSKGHTKEREVIKGPVVEQKTVGLIVLAGGQRLGYGASGFGGQYLINDLTDVVRSVIPARKYSILHSKPVGIGWYNKGTRHDGYRALCNKHGANQILTGLADGIDNEIAIFLFDCQNQQEIIDKSFGPPSGIEKKLMKFIKKHQLFQ